MKMKNCLIGFIIAMVSIIPISNIKALSIDGFEFDLPDLPTTKKSDYYTIAKNNNNDTYLIFFDNVKTVNGLDNSVVKIYYDLSLGGGSVSLSGKSYSHNVYYYKLVDNTWSYINYGKYDVILYDLENDIGITSEEWMSDINLVKPYLQDKILYTNLNYFACEANINNCKLFFSKEDLKAKENLSYEFELINDSYYSIRFYSDNFNSNYKYQIKFDYQDSFVDITNYLLNGSYNYTLTKNSTLYMQVLDENNEYVETKTMTFADITYNEEYYLPTADINVSYLTDDNNFSKANIDIKINNFSTLYYYKYSFNDIEDVNIYSSEFIDNKYSFDTYQNGTLYFYIYNAEGNIIFETSKQINQIIDNGLYYYYEFDIDRFYNSEDNSINTLMFYYKEGETLENNKKVIPYVNIYLKGNDNKILPFYITHSINVFDVNSYSRNISFDNVVSQYLPYEKLFNNNNISYRDNSYTAYAIAPIMDLINNTIDDYNDYTVVIRTNKKMSDNYFSFIGGIMLPQPIINNDLEESYKSKYTGFFDIFSNAFNRFKNVIIEIFQYCTYFFNSISPIMQDFYITVFLLIVFIFLIRFIL